MRGVATFFESHFTYLVCCCGYGSTFPKIALNYWNFIEFLNLIKIQEQQSSQPGEYMTVNELSYPL